MMPIRALILVAVIVGGCAPAVPSKSLPINTAERSSGNFPKNMYAAEFRVINLCDHAIVMNRCEGFETPASPEAGVLIPKAAAESVFPPVSEFPAKTTIHWHDEQDGQDHEQAIDLTNVVPRGVDGTTVFEFSKDQKWSVRFEPKTSTSQN